jgi:hypothetical protein
MVIIIIIIIVFICVHIERLMCNYEVKTNIENRENTDNNT